jgi:hypothetical protein
MGRKNKNTKRKLMTGKGKTKKRVAYGNRKTVILKKMNCSPEYKNNAYKDSCYNKKIIFKIRDAYNKNAKDEDKITFATFKEVYEDLKLKMYELGCVKEDCWLNQLPIKERNYLDSVVFAPDHPEKWNKNPNEWLSNYDINSIMKQYERFYPEFAFIGSTTMDFDTVLTDDDKKECVCNNMCNFKIRDYIKKGIRKIGFVVNLDYHTEGGSHWVSLFVDLDDRIIYYFDSARNETPEEITAFVKRISEQCLKEHIDMEYIENKISHQKTDTECGMYALFFVTTMLTGDIGDSKKMTKQEKIDLFTNTRISDNIMIRNRGTIFNNGGSNG